MGGHAQSDQSYPVVIEDEYGAPEIPRLCVPAECIDPVTHWVGAFVRHSGQSTILGVACRG